jgi:ketosteroid isomerase-like protein
MSIVYVVGAIGTILALSATPPLHLGPPSTRGGNDAHATERDRNVNVMLDLFTAIEQRDPSRRNVERELSFYQPDVEFHWPGALPYGGTFRGLAPRSGPDWNTTWTPLQPTGTERRMDPQVIGSSDHRVAILYHQRGVSPKGERFDGEVIGLYELRDFRLARAQMFYFDEAACARFLERAAAELKQMKR